MGGRHITEEYNGPMIRTVSPLRCQTDWASYIHVCAVS